MNRTYSRSATVFAGILGLVIPASSFAATVVTLSSGYIRYADETDLRMNVDNNGDEDATACPTEVRFVDANGVVLSSSMVAAAPQRANVADFTTTDPGGNATSIRVDVIYTASPDCKPLRPFLEVDPGDVAANRYEVSVSRGSRTK